MAGDHHLIVAGDRVAEGARASSALHMAACVGIAIATAAAGVRAAPNQAAVQALRRGCKGGAGGSKTNKFLFTSDGASVLHRCSFAALEAKSKLKS